MAERLTVPLCQAVSATVGLLNTGGGWMHVRLEKDDAARGGRLTAKLCQEILPNPLGYIECTTWSGIPDELVVQVRNGPEKPYFTAKEGMEKGCWQWTASGLEPLTQTQLMGWIQQTDGLDYEGQRSLEQALTLEEVKKEFLLHDLPFGKPQMKTLGLLGDHGLYTNLAYLLSDQRKNLTNIVWVEGNAPVGRKLGQTCVTGNFFEVSRQANAVIREYNIQRAKRRDQPEDTPDFSRMALLELSKVMMILRDFSRAEPMSIRLYNNRLEMLAPGSPQKSISYTEMWQGQSICRNPRLCRLIQRLYPQMPMSLNLGRYQRRFQRDPQLLKIEYDFDLYRATIPSVNEWRQANNRQLYPSRATALLTMLGENRRVCRSEAAQMMEMSEKQVAFLINRMVREGLLCLKDGMYQSTESVYYPYTPTFSPFHLDCAPISELQGWNF